MQKTRKNIPNKIQDALTLTHAYKDYSANVKVKSSDFNVSYKTYRRICQEFNKEISRMILEESFVFTIPAGLGKLRIRKFPMSLKRDKLHLDYVQTKKLKKAVYHLNEHTNNMAYRWHWDKETAITIGKRTYGFFPTRPNKRRIAELVFSKDYNVDYFE